MKVKVRETLKNRAKENANVTKGTKSNQEVLKKGTPVDTSNKTIPYKEAVVGMNKGVTKNMDNYESLRVDAWLSVPCENDPNVIEKTYKEVSSILDEVLEDVVSEYVED